MKMYLIDETKPKILFLLVENGINLDCMALLQLKMGLFLVFSSFFGKNQHIIHYRPIILNGTFIKYSPIY